MPARRGRVRRQDAPAGAPEWMVTFSDLVTLLLTFFVMLTAMANFSDVGRVNAVLESIRNALGADGFNTALVGVDSEEAYQVAEPERPKNLQPIMSKLAEILSRHVSDDMVRMSRTQTEIRVALSESVLFAAGSTEIHPAAYSLLSDLAGAMHDQPVLIRVEGHADGVGEAASNWRLSALRAVAVVDVLQQRGQLDGRKLEAVGFGQFRPTAIGSGGDSAWDRRVELVLSSTNRDAYGAINSLESGIGGLDGR